MDVRRLVRVPSPSGGRARVPGPLRGAEPLAGGGVLRFAHAVLRVRVTAGGAVLVAWNGASLPDSSASLPPADTRARLEPDLEDGWRIAAGRVRVCVSRSGAVETRTPGGLLLRRDLPPSWWSEEGRPETRWLLVTGYPADARLYGPGHPHAPGHAGPRLRPGTYATRGTAAGQQSGAGQEAAAGQFVVSDAGCHLVCHGHGEGTLTVFEGTEGAGSGHDRPGRSELRRSGGPLRYWVVPGEPSRALRLWTAMAGRPPLPPPWALGLEHSDPGLREEAAVRAEAAAFHAHGLAPSALHVGWAPPDGAPELASQLERRGTRLLTTATGRGRGTSTLRPPRPRGTDGWEELRTALGQVLARGLCGLPPEGPVVASPPGAGSAELYVRAFQLAAYLPRLRTLTAGHRGHGEPWAFGPHALDAARRALAERQRLLPYTITLALQAHRTGTPGVRPLWWADPGDRALRACEDAFLLGDALLVAPVLRKGVRERALPLPAGRWYDTATGRIHRGPGQTVVEAPLERMPVLARAGAVVPAAAPDGSPELHVWPPGPDGRGGGLLATAESPTAQAELVRLTVRRRGSDLDVRREDGRTLVWPVQRRG